MMFVLNYGPVIETTILYGWYRFVMALLKRRHQWRDRALPLYYLGVAIGVVGVLFDVYYNVVNGSLIFREFAPLWKGEFTLSQRLARYRKTLGATSWRRKTADRICKELNKHDPSGHHC